MATLPPIKITKAAIRRRKRVAWLKSWRDRIVAFLRRFPEAIPAPDWTVPGPAAVNPIAPAALPRPVAAPKPNPPARRGKIAVVAGATNCPACTQPITAGQPLARCVGSPSHAIHAGCRAFMRGKCPICQRESR